MTGGVSAPVTEHWYKPARFSRLILARSGVTEITPLAVLTRLHNLLLLFAGVT
jgi:hypothetical protein